MDIEGYSNYYIDDKGNVINKRSNKKVSETVVGTNSRKLKLKDDSGLWKSVSKTKVLSLSREVSPPKGFFKVPGFMYLWVNELGEVWSAPNRNFPLGSILAQSKTSKGYLRVTTIEGEIGVHQLIAFTFFDPEYLKRGLCVLHLDDDKTNNNKNNLKVGTYSENNKAAYLTGVNPSKKQ